MYTIYGFVFGLILTFSDHFYSHTFTFKFRDAFIFRKIDRIIRNLIAFHIQINNQHITHNNKLLDK